MEREYMKVAEVAKRFSVTRFTIYKWLEKGMRTGINLDGIIRVLRTSVDDLERASQIQPKILTARGPQNEEPTLG